jgi:NAD(P)-dependent dehydrogenase (short-subunit alcohol dehydrogenase family)
MNDSPLDSGRLLNDYSVEEWTDLYATNVVGPYLMTTAFLPLLQKATEHQHGYSGTVINITSISGLVRISQGHFSYNSSKGAMVHLNKLLAAEIARAGLKIRVNSIAPGVFPSEMSKSFPLTPKPWLKVCSNPGKRRQSEERDAQGP